MFGGRFVEEDMPANAGSRGPLAHVVVGGDGDNADHNIFCPFFSWVIVSHFSFR